jgi:hypothetical protein
MCTILQWIHALFLCWMALTVWMGGCHGRMLNTK